MSTDFTPDEIETAMAEAARVLRDKLPKDRGFVIFVADDEGSDARACSNFDFEDMQTIVAHFGELEMRQVRSEQ